MHHTKTTAGLFSLLFIIIILFPIRENWQPEPKDDFPLSYYPMFNSKRNNIYSLNYLVGYDENEKKYVIPYKYAGTGGLNQVRHQINKMRRTGRSKLLAISVAKRISRINKEPYNKITRVEFVRGTYNLDDYFLKNNSNPLQEKIIASQKIKRK